MNQIFTTVNALRKAVESSRPNVKFTKIMGYVDQLEKQLKGLKLCECPSIENTNNIEPPSETNPTEETPSETDGKNNEELENITIETIDEENNEHIVEESDTELNLEDLSLSELRELFPNIKATSKANFLEQLRAQ